MYGESQVPPEFVCVLWDVEWVVGKQIGAQRKSGRGVWPGAAGAGAKSAKGKHLMQMLVRNKTSGD